MRQISKEEKIILQYLSIQTIPLGFNKMRDNISDFDENVLAVLVVEGFILRTTVNFRWLYQITDEGKEILK